MDTDYLTPMAYETITHAYDVLDVLRSEIGASSRHFVAEDDFLNGTKEFLKKIIEAPKEYLDYWHYLDEMDIHEFALRVRSVLDHVETTLATPYEERGEPEFT